LRPQKEKSAIFYVALSLGGAVGTILVSILAPIYFKDFIEIYIILAVTAIVLTYIFVKNLLSENIYVFERLAMFGLVVVVSVVFMQDFVNNYRTESVNKIRNFYGVTELTDYEDKRQLNHGTTLHGEQYFDEKLRLIPTLYYSYESGVGRTVMLQQYLKPKRGLVVGVVGLGTGTMAAYCRPKDEFDFFEIDERIRSIAENSFSYLENCKNYKIIFGDGRLSLKNTPDGKYDVLAIDAFSDDSIPMHMVTKEAIQIFMDKTKDTGVLAVHTSNRYIDLEKVVKRIAFDLNIPAVTIGGGDENIGSVWILLARDEKLLINNIVKGKLEGVDRGTPLWTDDFTNIFPVMYQKLF
jgi:protein-L-isoaspartate O-methyltransferase